MLIRRTRNSEYHYIFRNFEKIENKCCYINEYGESACDEYSNHSIGYYYCNKHSMIYMDLLDVLDLLTTLKKYQNMLLKHTIKTLYCYLMIKPQLIHYNENGVIELFSECYDKIVDHYSNSNNTYIVKELLSLEKSIKYTTNEMIEINRNRKRINELKVNMLSEIHVSINNNEIPVICKGVNEIIQRFM